MTDTPISHAVSAAADAAPLDVAIIIPTFNEVDNVAPLIEKLGVALAGRRWEAIFVDDNSPDGTSERVREFGRIHPNIRVIKRVGRRGLSTAAIEGMLSTAAPIVAVMDGDMQHDEAALPAMIDAIASGDADMAIGTRYVEGGGVGDWDESRQLISRVATRLGQVVLRTKVNDPMSGFFALRLDAFERAVPHLSAIGFKILVDIIASSPTPLKIVEIPYHFRSRELGESKISSRVAIEYIEMLADKLVGRFIPIRLIKFLIVGGLGVFVHLATLKLALMFGAQFVTAQTIAVIVAIAFNFALHNSFTYADRKLKGSSLILGLLSFYAISAIGALANIGIGTWVASGQARWWVAGMAGILVGTIWNFTMSSVLTWRK